MYNKPVVLIIISIFIISITAIGGYGYGLLSYKYNLFPINQIKSFLKDKKYETNDISKHVYWTNEIRKGGYILHIRHGSREKWSTNVAYDDIELLNNLDARQSSFARAVCLTEKGVEDSKLVGEIFQIINIPIGHVVSSPSCRARETAIFAFGRIDSIEPSLLHRTAMRKDQHLGMGKKLREVVENLKIEKNKNIILSGHGGTLSYDFKNKVGIIDIMEVEDVDRRLETGIVVIEKIEGKYIAKHKFNNIIDIATNSIKLPIDDKSNGKFLWNKDKNTYVITPKSGYLFNHGD
tara:strand:+ start:90 stop:968 length:879 start_codon:yes stop_codon:yes gene_type:complete